MFRFEPIPLDSPTDTEGLLVFRDDRLIAVVSQLSDLHGGSAGCWFVEASFGLSPLTYPEPFVDLPQLESWLSTTLATN